MNFHALCSILLQHTNSPRVGLDSHFSGGSVSFRDYTPLVKINMYAPERDIGAFLDLDNFTILTCQLIDIKEGHQVFTRLKFRLDYRMQLK
jgi:hypothetical protein